MSADFYFGFFLNFDANYDSYLGVILTTNDPQPVSYTIEAPGIGYHHTGVVTHQRETTVTIPSQAEVLSIHDQNKGIYLTTSSDKVTVIAHSMKNNVYRNTDTFTVLPVPRLNADRYTYYAISSPESNDAYLSSILVVGTEDNTVMKLTVTQTVQVNMEGIIHTLVPGRQYSFVIARLQTVFIGAHGDLSGTKIVTDKLASVFSGNQKGFQHAPSYLAEQIPPTIFWDKVHYLSPVTHYNGNSILRVVAAYDSTTVDIYCNGNTKISDIINEGKPLTKLVTSHVFCAIHSTKEVLVAQFFKGNTSNGSFFTLVPGVNHYFSDPLTSTNYDSDFYWTYEHSFILIVLAEYYKPEIIHLTTGGITRTLNADGWASIKVNNVTEAYALQYFVKSGPFTIKHDNPAALMTVLIFGMSYNDGYSHCEGFNLQIFPGTQFHIILKFYNMHFAEVM